MSKIITHDERYLKYLLQELHEFEEKSPMTLTERKEVRKWVRTGNHIYRNPWYYYYDNGIEMNYLDALRFDKELINEMAEKMNSTQ